MAGYVGKILILLRIVASVTGKTTQPFASSAFWLTSSPIKTWRFAKRIKPISLFQFHELVTCEMIDSFSKPIFGAEQL
jgi:hypothetical protein